MAETPEYTRGPAEAGQTQLPMGEAKDLNDGMAVAQSMPAPALAPIKTATPASAPVMGGGDDDALFGPTHFPNEPVTAGAGMARTNTRPADLSAVIGDLADAAAVPGASPAVKNLLALLMHQTGQNA